MDPAAAVHEPSLARAHEAVLEDVVAGERLAAEGRFGEALETLALSAAARSGEPQLRLRALYLESWSHMRLGRVGEALAALDVARTLTDGPEFNDLRRAETLFRLGCCRTELAQLAQAVALFTLALELCDRESGAADPLVGRILEWRYRCYQRQGDWSAARDDVERVLELAERSDDRGNVARTLLEASEISSRSGDPLVARMYAEEARGLIEAGDDRPGIGRLLSSLAGLESRLGEHDRAVGHLEAANEVATELGDVGEIGRTLSALAQVHLARRAFPDAERAAREAIEALSTIDENHGDVRLLLGRALFEQGDLDGADEALAVADASARTPGARAAVWTARGDVGTARGDDRGAAAFYRRAAETLQDLRF
jgi:tetratricopeptide (TPR) repeat protein